MRILSGWSLALLLTAAASAQFRGVNPQPAVRGSFGNVVFPAGTSALPGVMRTFPNAVSPAGTAPRLVVPFGSNDPTRLMGNSFGRAYGNYGNYGNSQRRSRGATVIGVPYAVPVYVGGYGYDSDPQAAAPAPSQPNVIVIYPPAQQPVVLPPPETGYAVAPPAQPDQPPADQSSAEASHFLIAFKDHTIYSAVAYWVDGDTLHYFTTPSTHNQVSLSLVDKDLTQRLNREIGVSMQLP